MDDLKEYREKELKMYVIGNILMLILSTDMLAEYTMQENWFDLLAKILNSTLISSIIYVFVFIADSLFSNELKAKLLYLKSHMPGETVFSSIKNKNRDIRFTTTEALNKYSDIYKHLPNERTERYRYENAHWYSIYNNHRNNQMLFISNRDYLLCRDLYIATIVILLCYILACCFSAELEIKRNAIIYLVTMILITNFTCRTRGKRFVLNVLAYDIKSSNS